jgi:hypothetical protein
MILHFHSLSVRPLSICTIVDRSRPKPQHDRSRPFFDERPSRSFRELYTRSTAHERNKRKKTHAMQNLQTRRLPRHIKIHNHIDPLRLSLSRRPRSDKTSAFGPTPACQKNDNNKKAKETYTIPTFLNSPATQLPPSSQPATHLFSPILYQPIQ